MGIGREIAEGAFAVGNDIYNIYSNERARGDALEAQKRNEALLRESWARDDTARQRMVADLESAGLSKWMAAGASPMSSSPISLQSPGSTAFDGHSADALHHSYQDMLQEKMTEEQTETMAKQREAVDKSIEVQEAEKKIKEQELRMKTHDANVLDSRGDTMSNDPATMKYIAEILKTLKGESSRFSGFDNLLEDVQKVKQDRLAKRKERKVKKEIKEQKKDEEFVVSHGYERRQPMTMEQWMTQHNIPRDGSNAQIYAREYQRYRESFYRDSRARR